MADQIVPGPCNPIVGCPPPTEIVCIKTEKVFQECRHTFAPNAITFIVPAGVTANFVTCGPVFIQRSCPAPTVTCPPRGTNPPPGVPGNCPEIFFPGEVLHCKIDCCRHEVFTTSRSVSFEYTMVLSNGMSFVNCATVPIPLTPVDMTRFFLSRAGEPGLKCQLEVFVECTSCTISSRSSNGTIATIDCCFAITLIGKLISLVQLMVPAFGYCPLPEECLPPVLGPCPTIIPTGIPYPPETIFSPTVTPTPITLGSIGF